MSFWNYDLNQLVVQGHELRKVETCISFEELLKGFKDLEKATGREGYGVEVGIRCLFLQFFKDLSDREMEERLRDDLSFRWFCGFTLDAKTPDHSFFGRMRQTLGTKRIGQMFDKVVNAAKNKGIVRGVFVFVDASVVKSKETTWEQRDKALADGEEKLNNDNVGKYSADKDARFGCKGKKDFWYGFKRNVNVDMASGMIQKTAMTPANVPDSKGFEKVCPKDAMVFADKGYCGKNVQQELEKNNCHSGVILKNNMKAKNKDKDSWLTKARAPFERVFSKLSDRARYRGIAKMQLQGFMQAFVHNVKRLLVLDSPPIFAGA